MTEDEYAIVDRLLDRLAEMGDDLSQCPEGSFEEMNCNPAMGDCRECWLNWAKREAEKSK